MQPLEFANPKTLGVLLTPHFGQARELFFLGQPGLLRSCGEEVFLGPDE